MPQRPLHPCAHPGCPALVRDTPRCEAHARKPWAGRPSAEARGYRSDGGAWQRLRQAILERDAYLCQIRGPRCTGLATQVDHIRPKADGGSDDPANLRASCTRCNLATRARAS